MSETALTQAMTRILEGETAELPDDAGVCAWHVLRYEPDVPLTAEQQTELAEVLRTALASAGECAIRFADDEDAATILLAATAFPAKLYRDTVMWLCLAQINEMCSLTLEQEGVLLVSDEFAAAADWRLQSDLCEPSEWWSHVAPTDGPTAHRHRAALQTIVKRRQYHSIAGYATRSLRTADNLAYACFGFIPLVVESVWTMHAEMSLASILTGLDLNEMVRRPREALESWLGELAQLLRACPQAPENAPIERVIAAIRTDCSLPYTQANLSRSLGLTPAYFCRLFRDKTGQHFSNFLTITRMERAQELMQQGGLSLSELSERCGYPNKSYFCQVFKKYAGMTPGEYEQRVLLQRLNDA